MLQKFYTLQKNKII